MPGDEPKYDLAERTAAFGEDAVRWARSIRLCARESRESKHWLRMLGQTIPEDNKDEHRALWIEADELARIFATIHRNSTHPT